MNVQRKILENLKRLENWGVVATGDDASLRALVTGKDASIQLRVIDGKEGRDHDAFMKSLWRPLELPSYFGENWSAFDDVIQDMEWLQADAYIIIFADANEVLSTNGEDFKTLVELLSDAHFTWKNPDSDGFISSWTNDPKDMFFVFQVGSDKKEEMVERLRGADVKLPVVQIHDLTEESE